MGISKTARRKKRAKRLKRIKASASQPEATLSFQAVASFDDDSFEASGDAVEATPSFSLQAYNGGKMSPHGMKVPVVVDVKGVQHDARVPVFLDHEVNGRNIVGHSSVSTDGTITAEGIVSGDTEAARTVVSSAKKGFPWQVSIGATILEKDYVATGKTKVINGQVHEGPFNHIVKSSLHELSFVPIGADRSTSAAIAATNLGGTDMADKPNEDIQVELKDWLSENKLEFSKFEQWLDQNDADWVKATDEEKDKLKLAYRVEIDNERRQAAAAAEKAHVESMRLESAAELERQRKIKEITKFDAELREDAIRSGWSSERTELELLRKEYRRKPKSNTSATRQMASNANVIEAAMCMQEGVDPKWLDKNDSHWSDFRSPIRGYSEQEIDAATDLGEYSFSRLFHEFLSAYGISVAPGEHMDGLIEKVKNTHRTIKASTGFSSIDISGILSNVMGKNLLSMFESVRPVAQRISTSRAVRDFKETKNFRLTGNGDFLPVGPTGELLAMQLQEEEYPNKPVTYGRLINISREMLINDDLGALNGVTRILGRKAALILQKKFFEMFVALEAGNAGDFFGSDNDNLITDPLGIAGLTAGEQKFLDQTDADGDPIDVEPEILLVPSTLKVTAEELMDATSSMIYDRDTGATATTRGPTTNPHVGKWNIEWSPWLRKFGEADQDTAWWLLGPPGIIPTMEIVYLGGRQTPHIQSEDADFSVLGFQWRSYFDFGIAPQDYRGGVKSVGDGT